MYNVIIEQEAQDEIEAAYRFYLETVSLKVADMFYNDIEEAFDALEINPFYQIRTKSYRAIPLKLFPFLIFFDVNELDKSVNILAVFNTHRDSQKWPWDTKSSFLRQLTTTILDYYYEAFMAFFYSTKSSI